MFHRRFTLALLLALLAVVLFVPACGDDPSTGSGQADDDNDQATDDDNDDATDDDTDEPGPLGDPVAYVDPLIGTARYAWGRGALAPGPQAPNGLVKLGPDTQFGDIYNPLLHSGGYWYPDTVIRGLTHLHLPGTGITDLGNINLMPVEGIDDGQVNPAGYRSPFRHETEVAEAGYYAVTLDRYNVEVKLTATPNVGYHRYTYRAGAQTPYVVIDSSYSLTPFASQGGEVGIDAEAREVHGYTDQHGGFSRSYGGMPVYFVARFSEPFVDVGTFNQGVRDPGGSATTGTHIGAYVGFAPAVTVVEAKVGISLIDVDQARANLDAEIPDWSFPDIVAANRESWRELLSDVLVEGGTAEQRTNFYTAMYHLYVLPTKLTEAGRRYRGFDREVHEAADFDFYTDLSLWDTFRTFHPLMTILRPEMARDFVVSMLRIYEQNGAMPKWAQGIGETEVMIGTHADTVVADTYLKGVTDFDVAATYAGLREHAVGPVPLAGRVGIEDWLELGYVSNRGQDQSVSRTLEFSLNDYCLGQLAAAIGEDEDAAMFGARANNFRNLWDDQTLFFRPKNPAGQFKEPFFEGSQALNVNGYTEGTPRQWRWFVLHDVPGLVDLFGEPEVFVRELDEFIRRGKNSDAWLLMPPYYWHGNEPDMHAAYLFDYAGRPDLTAQWVRWLMDNRYSNAVDGLDGNDDGGTLSAWYIFSALGFYPLPCTNQYALGSPIFPKATVRVGEHTLEVIAENTSAENIHVQSVTLNGETLTVPWFEHEAIAHGGTLHFVMGPDPNDDAYAGVAD